MKKLFIFTLILMLVITGGTLASDLKFGGKLEQKLEYTDIDEIVKGTTNLNLEITKEFGFDKKLYFNPEINLDYNRDNSSEDNFKMDFKLKQIYFDLYLNKIDLRVGNQLINWGSAFKINPTSVVNPIDYTVSDLDETRLPVNAVKGKYYHNYNTIISGVIADFKSASIPDKIKSEQKMKLEEGLKAQLTEIISQSLSQTAAQQQADQLVNNSLSYHTVEPELNGLKDLEYAFRLTKRNWNGYDVSLNYFNGYEDRPSLASNLEQVTETLIQNPPARINYGYKQTQSLGINIIGSIKEIGVWCETNYSYNEDEEAKLDTVLGGDYTCENNLYTVAQYFHRSYNNYEHNKSNLDFLMIQNKKPFRQIHEWKITTVYDLNHDSLVVNPEMDLSLLNNLSLNIGTLIKHNQKDTAANSMLNMMGEEKSYARISYSF